MKYHDKIEETTKIIHNEGGITFVVDPGMKNGATIGKTKDLWAARLIDGIQLSPRISRKDHERIMAALGPTSLPIVPVSNAKGYRRAGTSYIEMQGDREGKFTIDDFSRKLEAREFTSQFGRLPWLRRLLPI